MHSESPAPGPLVRWTIAAGAAATAVAVTSAALDLGRGHWGAAIVALPLLVAAAVIAKLAYPTLLAPTATAVVLLLAAIATGGLVGWTGDARWAVALHVARGRSEVRTTLVGLAVSAAPSGRRFGLCATTEADETADHVALLLTGAAGMSSAAEACRTGGSSPR